MDHLNILLILIGGNRRLSLKMRENIGTAESIGQGACCTNQCTYMLSYLVCVYFLPIISGHQVRWTYQPGSHRRKVTEDFFIHFPSSAVRALIFLAGRIQPFLSLVDREVEFCVLTI